MVVNMQQRASEMSEKASEKSEMSCVDFVSYGLREHIAPPGVGPVKARIRHASRKLGWTPNRTKDAWYADPRIALSADEVRDIEEQTGLRYGRQELKAIDAYISRAEALLEGADEDFHRPFVAAMRAFFGALDRS
jgi:hypothetical protein